MLKAFTVRFTERMHKALKNYADERGLSLNAATSLAVYEFLKSQGYMK